MSAKPEVIKIWCRSKERGHRKKGVFIVAFVRGAEGTWQQDFTSRYSRAAHTKPGDNVPDCGQWVLDDEIPPEGWSHDSLIPPEGNWRSVYKIACPICAPGATPRDQHRSSNQKGAVTATEEKMNAVLEGLSRAGINDPDITLLRAMVHSRAH